MIILLVSLGYIVNSSNILVTFYTDPILLEFIFGMVAFYVYSAASKRVDSLRTVFIKFGFFLGITLYMSLFLLQSEDGQAHRYFFWGLPCLVVFLLVVLAGRKIRIWLGFVMLGNISYSLYLFHPYVIHFIDRKVFSINSASWSAYLVTLGAYVAAIAIAYCSWRFVEKPSQRFLLPVSVR